MTLQEQLAAAQSALHQLQTGQMARVYVDQNGERIEYGPAKKSDLQAYILSLQAMIANGGVVPTLRPLTFLF